MTNPQPEEKRTLRQNDAIHLYLELVARELANQGQTLQGVVKKVEWAEITPSAKAIKEVIWRPIMETVVGKKSTTQLTTAEVNKVYEIISMFLAKEFEISLPFPSIEESENYLKSLDQLK
jgi:ribosomal protein S26